MLINQPEPGFYKKRIRKRGPWAPVKVRWKVKPRLLVSKRERTIPGVLECVWAPATNKVKWHTLDLDRAWLTLHPITKDEFEWLIALKSL